MFKSCSYCGKIHDVKHVCASKPKRRERTVDKSNENSVAIRKFRDSPAWRNKRSEIKDRDMHLCQVCMLKLYNTINQYTYDNTSVHHIHPLSKAWSKRLDNDNLITLCSLHHSYADSGYIPMEVLIEIVSNIQK